MVIKNWDKVNKIIFYNFVICYPTKKSTLLIRASSVNEVDVGKENN